MAFTRLSNLINITINQIIKLRGAAGSRVCIFSIVLFGWVFVDLVLLFLLKAQKEEYDIAASFLHMHASEK